VKEIWGAGEQQVRNIWSNTGCWHLNQWMSTLVELCSWDVAKPKLTDRGQRPWDNPDRRPSQADRRSTIVREMLGKQFLAALPQPEPAEIQNADQGRHQPLHMTKTIRSADSCLFHQKLECNFTSSVCASHTSGSPTVKLSPKPQGKRDICYTGQPDFGPSE
jgi:hypothetical protein